MPAIGWILALTIAAEIGEIERFPSPEKLAVEATMHALRHPAYTERYQHTKRRLGKQRAAKVAQVDIPRRLAHAIWHMLSRKEKFAPRGAAFRLAARPPFWDLPPSEHPISPDPPDEKAIKTSASLQDQEP